MSTPSREMEATEIDKIADGLIKTYVRRSLTCQKQDKWTAIYLPSRCLAVPARDGHLLLLKQRKSQERAVEMKSNLFAVCLEPVQKLSYHTLKIQDVQYLKYTEI